MKSKKLLITAVVALLAVAAVTGLVGIRNGLTMVEISTPQGNESQRQSESVVPGEAPMVEQQQNEESLPPEPPGVPEEVRWAEKDLNNPVAVPDPNPLGPSGAVSYQEYVAVYKDWPTFNGENLRCYISFPVLGGYENKNLEKWWNQHFWRLSRVDKFKNDPDIQSVEECARPSDPSGDQVNVDISLLTSRMISLDFSTYSEGGVHPTFSYQATTLDLNTGVPIPMKMLFKPGYKEVFKQLAQEQLDKQRLAEMKQDYETGEDLMEVMLAWMENGETTAGIQFTDTALIFTLDPRFHGYSYVVGGPVSVEIPYSRIKDLVLSGGYLEEVVKP